MSAVRRFLNSIPFLWFVMLLPALWMLNGWRIEELFYGEILHITGELSARLMMLSMAVTPFRLMFPNANWPNWLLHRRRYIGIASFIYAALHTIVYLDRKRDLSLILDESVAWAQVQDLVEGDSPERLEACTFVGAYRGKQVGAGKKSLTLRLTFRDPDRTLRHEEVDPQVDGVMERVKRELGAEIRA